MDDFETPYPYSAGDLNTAEIKNLENQNLQDRLKTLIPYSEDKKNFVFDIHLQGKKETIFFEF